MSKKHTTKPYTFIDLFAGIGGFHRAFHKEGAYCVFACEIDDEARKTYKHFHKDKAAHLFEAEDELFPKDIRKVDPADVPDFHILTAGFPCQAFSQAGYKKGFGDPRGTLFFDIVRILEEKRPHAYFLENVRHLKKHDDGRTFRTIKKILEDDLGYSFYHKIVKASDHGLPQHRPRIFMVGFRDPSVDFDFPEPTGLKKTMSDIFKGDAEREVGYTLRVGGRGSGIDDRRNWDAYRVDGEVRRLGPKEGLKMMGFDARYKMPVSETQAMKQLGNAVAVPAIQATAKQIIRSLNNHHDGK